MASIDNYTVGKGLVSFKKTGATAFADMGNCTEFEFTPEIYILLGAKPEELGSVINALRARFVKSVLDDSQLGSIVGTNGDIRYEGCATALARGRSMEGEMGVSFSFTYVLRPEEL